ncbi:hypothetical protein ACP275_04G153800 [Erythranthe tilingii]
MAYAAAISLTHTIERLSNSCRISVVSNSSLEIINLLYDEVYSVLGVVEEKPDIICNINMRRKINVFDEQIRETLYEFEDVLETRVLQQFLPQSDIQEEVKEIQYPLPLFSLDLQELKQNIDSFTQKLNKMKAAYIQEQGDDGFDDVIVQSKFDFGGRSDQLKMIGLSDQFTEIKNQLIDNFSQGSALVSLVGMAGIGKTTLANKLFHDPSISSLYRKRAFVKLGPKYQLERILLDILKQLNHDIDVDEEKVLITEEGENVLDGLKRLIRESITNRTYFIVLDDLWDKDEFYMLTSFFPFLRNGSQVLVTTRLQKVAQKANRDCINTIRFLDKKESWELLRHKVFDEMPCPPELEKAGKKIAENCEGLPLTIVTVADTLSKGEKSTEYWNEVAADKRNAVFVDAYDEMFEVLYPSYAYLYQHLKPCFLYMGVFRQNHEISRSKLVNLLIVEGFLEPGYEDANMFFKELVSNSLVMVQKQSFVTKTFSLPSPFWYLCDKESKKNKFFLALNGYADGSAQECVKSQRRLAIRNNILFSIKDVHDSIASASMILKLRCYAFRGPTWDVCNGEFRKLRYLLIEDTNLVHWTFGDGLCLYFLEFLGIHDCYKLEEIPLTYSKNHYLKKIELVDSNPMALSCANKLKEDWDHEYGGKGPLVVNFHSSWDA